MKFNQQITLILLIASFCLNAGCEKKAGGNPGENIPVKTPDVAVYLTKGDQSALLKKQDVFLPFVTESNANPTIEVDTSITYQTVDGFGYTLTGGSAQLINKLPAAQKSALLQELFGNQVNSLGISCLRLSIGASDLSSEVFSYNDLPAGQADPALAAFSLSKDTIDLIPLLKEIIAINPTVKFIGSPWSAPVWMKDNGSSIGGSLQPQYYSVYAAYLVKYIQAMKQKGITLDAITLQNEPQHGGNNPSMVWTATQQAEFVKTNLGPAFQAASINTKIIVWDHNCDNPNYPITIMNDAAAKKYIDGAAFHLYAGDISALSTVHAAHPDKNLYFTEQWTGSTGSFDGDFKWHIKNVVIGSMRNWSRVALEWNLANDGGFNPHTPGGCTQCKGALTLDGAINRNVAYYIIGQISMFVPPSSIRIESTQAGSIFSVAFKRPDGKKVLIAMNDGSTTQSFNIKFKGKIAIASLEAGAAATYLWN